jgi:hypothetical protein
MSLISAKVMRAHRATWFVWAGGVKMRRQATMRGFWGYDATCSCGKFETRTGGANRRTVEDMLFGHRLDAQLTEETTGFRCDTCKMAPGSPCYEGARELDYLHPARWAAAAKARES